MSNSQCIVDASRGQAHHERDEKDPHQPICISITTLSTTSHSLLSSITINDHVHYATPSPPPPVSDSITHIKKPRDNSMPCAYHVVLSNVPSPLYPHSSIRSKHALCFILCKVGESACARRRLLGFITGGLDGFDALALTFNSGESSCITWGALRCCLLK